MSTEYTNNHYVPQWYQKRFIPEGQIDNELFYLNLKPGVFTDPRGVVHDKRAVIKQGTRLCFAEDDLYTTWFGGQRRTDIEKIFFGQVDDYGRKAVDFFANYDHLAYEWDPSAYRSLMLYMSTQKLRTPKGLGWLAKKANTTNRFVILQTMLRLRQLYGAIWTESIWQIADASQSDTKFIISDHPITSYNRFLGPRNKKWCRGFDDPDVALNATHTIFPLSIDKVLILTNLSWVRNPYQSGIDYRPNPNPLRSAMFNFQTIQISRQLSEQEVREINFIIKSRAHRYIAAANKEWLYPEKYVSKSDWNSYGDGLLLMPDPRGVDYTTEILVGNNDGTAYAFDEYGRRPWEEGYSPTSVPNDDFNTLERFKGDFAAIFGPKRRGRAFTITDLDPIEDSDDMHAYHLSKASKKYRRDCSASPTCA
ncbi:DUF4238 domain-containing protein [Patescibacteria group bacterium]|nr:MAG: DUF4238 domain-containing protein [Patescibacteria group bacterium]